MEDHDVSDSEGTSKVQQKIRVVVDSASESHNSSSEAENNIQQSAKPRQTQNVVLIDDSSEDVQSEKETHPSNQVQNLTAENESSNGTISNEEEENNSKDKPNRGVMATSSKFQPNSRDEDERKGAKTLNNQNTEKGHSSDEETNKTTVKIQKNLAAQQRNRSDQLNQEQKRNKSKPHLEIDSDQQEEDEGDENQEMKEGSGANQPSDSKHSNHPKHSNHQNSLNNEIVSDHSSSTSDLHEKHTSEKNPIKNSPKPQPEEINLTFSSDDSLPQASMSSNKIGIYQSKKRRRTLTHDLSTIITDKRISKPMKENLNADNSSETSETAKNTTPKKNNSSKTTNATMSNQSVPATKQNKQNSYSAQLNGEKKISKPKKSKINEDPQYEVEAIEDDRIDEKGQHFYFVHWKGYRACDNTWEPEENVKHLNAYKTYLKGKSEVKKKTEN